jgi:arylsulfatase A-like enzyme
VRNETFLAELGRITDRSFFAWVHYFDPHGDYVPPPPYDEMYPVGSEYEPVPPHPGMNLSKERKAGPVDPDRIIPLYKGEISFVDDQVGRLVRFLKERKVYEKTLIVLVADYGESRDLKNQEPARARQLEATLEEWLKRAKSMALPTEQPRKLDPKTRKALKTLGYID